MHQPGKSYPLGATPSGQGVNFSVYARHAVKVELLLFDTIEQRQPARTLPLFRTFDYWHAFVPGIEPGQLYAYRASGPHAPSEGHRYDHQKILLDPYARAVAVPEDYDREVAKRPGLCSARKGVVVDRRGYDWEGDEPPRHPFDRTILYEVHLAGFTKHPSSGVSQPGTFSGLVEKIPYLQELGITAVELLPVFHFDEQDAPAGLTNFWGYSPVSFFAVHPAFSAASDPLRVLDEFRDMVKALHRAGIEVILDVVYNHTAEGDETGPTLSLRGLDNEVYYTLGEEPGTFANYSGCGNTLNANRSVVRRLIVDSLRYWVTEMHVDGFRFDLASILARDEDGEPLSNPPVLWEIETDPMLAGAKLIAEAWDAGGLYQVGSFIGDRWAEWNGRFRDDVRRFLKADPGSLKVLPERLLASPDIFAHEEREPEQSINFVTCHDGFTLNDVVSYNDKHNQANLEQSRDGTPTNFSWNCGVEGPSDDPEVEALRNRQVKNFFTINLLSVGVPMLLAGDEFRRTQWGNNNAYCQDSELSWVDWRLLERHRSLQRFVSRLIALRQSLELYRRERNLTLNQFLEEAAIRWHGTRLDEPDWSEHSHSLALTIEGEREHMHFIFNSYWKPLEFELPAPPTVWWRVLDTSLESPEDITDRGQSMHQPPTYSCAARSCVVLLSSTSR
ncbi:MAG: glycogen debranching protein GlgX [Vulcanimicrobiota bacterium]